MPHLRWWCSDIKNCITRGRGVKGRFRLLWDDNTFWLLENRNKFFATKSQLLCLCILRYGDQFFVNQVAPYWHCTHIENYTRHRDNNTSGWCVPRSGEIENFQVRFEDRAAMTSSVQMGVKIYEVPVGKFLVWKAWWFFEFYTRSAKSGLEREYSKLKNKRVQKASVKNDW